jgi:hypothetical protein
MQQIDPNSMAAIQPELTSGESVQWAGQPNTRVIFHKEDFFLIPFSLFWGGFTIFWELIASGFWGSKGGAGAPSFFLIWGIPFVLVGQYLIWGRFLYVAWLKKRTNYAVTNRRVVVVQDGWSRRVASAYLDTLPTIVKEGASSGTGVLRFAPVAPSWSTRQGWGAWNVMNVGEVPTFMDIDDVDSVYRLVSDLREKARGAASNTSVNNW